MLAEAVSGGGKASSTSASVDFENACEVYFDGNPFLFTTTATAEDVVPCAIFYFDKRISRHV